MPPHKTINGTGLERWRGEVSAKLEDISRRLSELGERVEKALTRHVDEDHESFGNLNERVNEAEKVEARLAAKLAVAAMIGGAVTAAAVETVIRRLFG